VLRKVYYRNALRHLPSLRPSIEKQFAARGLRMTAAPRPAVPARPAGE
jgi:hypothetical protein